MAERAVTTGRQRSIAADGRVSFTFGGQAAIDTITPGELVQLQTLDCFSGKVKSVDDLPSQVCQFPYLNPVTGPLHVAGARPGDTLAVHVVSLTPAADHGFSSTFPHFGALTGTHTTAMLQPPLEERVWRYEIDHARGTIRYAARASDHRIDLPLAPMLGTVGVAPAGGEVRATIACAAHGGNLDTPLIRPGTTVFLQVNEPGALLGVGDGHARQGDGEACGVAVEVPMHVTLAVDVVPATTTPWPRLESADALMSVGVARPLEDAYRIAHEDLVRQVVAATGLDLLDAYQLVSQAGRARVGNVVDENYTIVAAIDKSLLGSRPAYGGVHGRLAALGGAE